MMKHSQLFLYLHSSLQHPLQESRKCYYLHFSAEKMRKCGIKVRVQVISGEREGASPNSPLSSCPGQGASTYTAPRQLWQQGLCGQSQIFTKIAINASTSLTYIFSTCSVILGLSCKRSNNKAISF